MRTEGQLTWRRVRGLPGVGHVEGGLLDQRRRVHAPPDEEAGSAAEEDAHHEEEPGGAQAQREGQGGPGSRSAGQRPAARSPGLGSPVRVCLCRHCPALQAWPLAGASSLGQLAMGRALSRDEAHTM